MIAAKRLLLSAVLGVAVTLLSTFVRPRMSTAIYPDIMGCETGCAVVATGWPFLFVRDYKGMSVGNRADVLEVWLAADLFDWLPFLANVILWSAALYLLRTLWLRRQVQSDR